MQRRNHANWSVSLGVWSGVEVRLHASCLLLGLGMAYVAWLAGRPADGANWSVVAAGLGVLAVSVVLHELAHAVTTLRLGGDIDEIVLAPWGGLEPPRIPGEPQAELLVHLAGPIINAALAGALAAPILFAQEPGNLWGLMWPFSPVELTDGVWWLVGMKLFFWVNCVLVYVNLIPVFPFDGGRILRSALVAYWPGIGPRAAVAAVALLAKVLAVTFGVMAFMLREQASTGYVHVSFGLALLGVFVWFSARQEEMRLDEPTDDETPFGYDFSQGYTSLEQNAERPPTEPGPISRWFEQRRAARQRRQQEIEAEEERRVDEILARLHAVGMNNLTPEERALLDRVSVRYRNRQENQT